MVFNQSKTVFREISQLRLAIILIYIKKKKKVELSYRNETRKQRERTGFRHSMTIFCEVSIVSIIKHIQSSEKGSK